jgi:hypothetical protein
LRSVQHPHSVVLRKRSKTFTLNLPTKETKYYGYTSKTWR